MADIIIVGAGTAGLSAAIYALRAGKSVILMEQLAYGGQIINTPEVENYPGIKSISGFDFAQGLYEQAPCQSARGASRYLQLYPLQYGIEILIILQA